LATDGLTTLQSCDVDREGPLRAAVAALLLACAVA
jgi:hypothetical protein